MVAIAAKWECQGHSSIFFQSAQVVRKSLDFLSSNSLLLAPTRFFSSRVPYIVKLPVKQLLYFQRKNDVIIPDYSESAPHAEQNILGIHSVYSGIGIETRTEYSGLFHLFLFRNKVNRTHPKCDKTTGNKFDKDDL